MAERMRLACALLLLPCLPGLQEPWPDPLPRDGLLDPGPLPPSVEVLRSEPGRWRLRFRLEAPEARRVHLAGSFNGWEAGATPMRRNGRRWSVILDLPAGVHAYKFVLDGGRWIPDPGNPEREPDGFHGFNSILRLGRLARLESSPARTGDGRIETTGLAHDPASPTDAASAGPGLWRLRFRTLAHDVEAVRLVWRGGEAEMFPVLRGRLQDLWESPPVALRPGQPYSFVLRDGGLEARDPRIFTMERKDAEPFQTPAWARHAIWYQIMPDRFRNGDPSNDPDPVRPWTSEWFSVSPWEEASGETFYAYFVYRRMYGGDLQGLMEALPYLEDLGVNALYLTPVFQAESPHKYNATDYRHVDERFGRKGDYAEAAAREDLLDPSTWTWTDSDRLFLEFLARAHERGFKVILDGVFNHVGTAHPAFQDVLRYKEKSRFAEWFAVRSWEPFEYEGWAGFGELPVFRKSATGFHSPEVKEHIFAITRRWMDPNGDGDPSDGIDGWRLDVPNEIPMPFWAEWRRLVKSINPEAYLSGEIWTRAEDWLGPHAFDAVMNYEFAKVALQWIGDRRNKIGAAEAERRLAELRLAYPEPSLPVLMNLLDSHDTDRLASMMQNPDLPYDRMNRVQDDHHGYDNGRPGPRAWQKARLAALLQHTWIGAPMIWYGDEAGLWGADDPTNRKPMLWKDLEPYEKPEENFVVDEQLDWYRRLVHLRRAHPALRTASARTLHASDEDEVWAFLREDESEEVLVALHAGEGGAEVLLEGLGEGWRALLLDEETSFETAGGGLRLRLGAFRGLVLGRPRP